MMKFLSYLQEEYITNITGKHSERYSGFTEVFCNPTGEELRSLNNNVRFIINFKTKKLYIWDWMVVHYEVAAELYKEKLIPTKNLGKDIFWETCFAGAGEKEGNKIKYNFASDYIKYVDPKIIKWLKDDDKWLNAWFVPSLIKTIITREHFDLVIE